MGGGRGGTQAGREAERVGMPGLVGRQAGRFQEAEVTVRLGNARVSTPACLD